MDILVVDDSPIVIKYLRFHLQTDNIKILEASSTDQALELLKNGTFPKLIISDYYTDHQGGGMKILNYILEKNLPIKFVFYTHYLGIRCPEDDGRVLGTVEKANFDKLHDLVKNIAAKSSR
jgi:CheY-like chemotaxis protein